MTEISDDDRERVNKYYERIFNAIHLTNQSLTILCNKSTMHTLNEFEHQCYEHACRTMKLLFLKVEAMYESPPDDQESIS